MELGEFTKDRLSSFLAAEVSQLESMGLQKQKGLKKENYLYVKDIKPLTKYGPGPFLFYLYKNLLKIS